jgi:predicted transcriptional regulator of viral defense system
VPDESAPHAHFRQARAAEVAARQWGNITRRQLLAIGFSKAEVRGMADRRWLHRMHRGVYAFGAISPAPEARWAAALLAAGDGSALSHTTAAAAYGQLPIRGVIEVTAPKQRRGDGRLRVHERPAIEVTRRRGLTVTSPAQTLLDLAAIGWPIDRLTHEMAAASIVSLDALRTFARNRRGEPGAAALKKALALPHTRSNWEREFLRWIKSLADIPQPILNDPIDHLTVDVHWPDHNLIIELDTDQTHGTAWSIRNDEERDDWLQQRRAKEVWRIKRETWDREALATQLGKRLVT